MARFLLTSSGLDARCVRNTLEKWLQRPAELCRVFFIPTAALLKGDIAYIEACREELIGFGIKEENIFTHNLDTGAGFETMQNCDLVYVAGGNTQYLLEAMQNTDFHQHLKTYDGIYLGVSAGSIALSGNGLGVLKSSLSVHQETGTSLGVFQDDSTNEIALTDAQAICISEDGTLVIGDETPTA